MHRSVAAFATVLSVAGALASAGPAQFHVVTRAEARPGPQGPDKPPAQPTMLRRVLVAEAGPPEKPQRTVRAEEPPGSSGPQKPTKPQRVLLAEDPTPAQGPQKPTKPHRALLAATPFS